MTEVDKAQQLKALEEKHKCLTDKLAALQKQQEAELEALMNELNKKAAEKLQAQSKTYKTTIGNLQNQLTAAENKVLNNEAKIKEILTLFEEPGSQHQEEQSSIPADLIPDEGMDMQGFGVPPGFDDSDSTIPQHAIPLDVQKPKRNPNDFQVSDELVLKATSEASKGAISKDTFIKIVEVVADLQGELLIELTHKERTERRGVYNEIPKWTEVWENYTFKYDSICEECEINVVTKIGMPIPIFYQAFEKHSQDREIAAYFDSMFNKKILEKKAPNKFLTKEDMKNVIATFKQFLAEENKTIEAIKKEITQPIQVFPEIIKMRRNDYLYFKTKIEDEEIEYFKINNKDSESVELVEELTKVIAAIEENVKTFMN